MGYDGRIPEPPYQTPDTEDYMAAHIESLQSERDRVNVALAEANATLDRLREAVPEVLPPHMSWKNALDGARAILYPSETTNDDR